MWELGAFFSHNLESYDSLGCIASHCFFKNLWQLLSQYSVTLNLPSDSAIPLLQEEDQPFMDAIQATSIFTTPELVDINQFCHWKKAHLIGDIVSCDGLTIKPTMITRTERVSNREFPLQQPTQASFELWKHAISSLTITRTKLRTPLGAYVGTPHQPDVWFTDAEGSQTYQTLPNGQCKVYKQPRIGQSMQFGTIYKLMDGTITHPVHTHRVSV
jgi:hypothetical protein